MMALRTSGKRLSPTHEGIQLRQFSLVLLNQKAGNLAHALAQNLHHGTDAEVLLRQRPDGLAFPPGHWH